MIILSQKVKYKDFMPVYIENVEIGPKFAFDERLPISATLAEQTDEQGKIELLSQWTMDC